MVMSTALRSQTLDQSQLVYDNAQSARNLPGFSTWQSFTAGLTGTLSQIDQAFASTMTGTATLKIYSGNGTAGTLLHMAGVTLSGSVNFWQPFTISPPVDVSAGQIYTWELIPTQGGGLPDPYAVQLSGINDTYAGGRCDFNPTWDAVFRTFVNTSVGLAATGSDHSGPMIQPNPFNTQTTLRTDKALRNATLTIYNAVGQKIEQLDGLTGQTVIVNRDDLPSGLYFLCLTENSRTISVDRVVVTDH